MSAPARDLATINRDIAQLEVERRAFLGHLEERRRALQEEKARAGYALAQARPRPVHMTADICERRSALARLTSERAQKDQRLVARRLDLAQISAHRKRAVELEDMEAAKALDPELNEIEAAIAETEAEIARLDARIGEAALAVTAAVSLQRAREESGEDGDVAAS